MDIEEYSASVTGYIRKCIQDATQANQKPWLTTKVHNLLKARDAAFKLEDMMALSTARANLSGAIREAKCTYAQKINSHFMGFRDTAHVVANTGWY